MDDARYCGRPYMDSALGGTCPPPAWFRFNLPRTMQCYYQTFFGDRSRSAGVASVDNNSTRSFVNFLQQTQKPQEHQVDYTGREVATAGLVFADNRSPFDPVVSRDLSGKKVQDSKLLKIENGITIIPKAISCVSPNCDCQGFHPGSKEVKLCDVCQHSWIIHAVGKMDTGPVYESPNHEDAIVPNNVLDVASLVLYGTEATPVRLKILLDRLLSVLQHHGVIQILQGLGWSYEDYARGYKLQDPTGRVLDQWDMTTREEEHIVISQFLRFGETRSLAAEIIHRECNALSRPNRSLLRESAPNDSRENDNCKAEQRSPIELTVTSREPRRPSSTGKSSPRSFSSDICSGPTLTSFTPDRSVGAAFTQTGPGCFPAGGLKNDSHPASNELDQSLDLTTTRKEIPSRIENPIQRTFIVNVPPAEGSVDLTPDPPRNAWKSFSRDEIRETFGAMMDHENVFNPKRMKSVFDSKLKHVRKVGNAQAKALWSPISLPLCDTTKLMSTNGKRRVVCNTCKKSFCDKGALKIHYSAVHLKEMHRCTVTGCNMLFSSRRSRNRHSANPNPKLHRPQKQKLPDGASVIDDGSLHISRIHGLLNDHSSASFLSKGVSAELLRSRHSFVLQQRKRHDDLYRLTDENRPLAFCPLSKRPRLQSQSSPEHVVKSPSNARDFEGENLSGDIVSDRSESDSEKTVNGSRRDKRKSITPTRCRQDNECYPTSDDDSSSDGAIDSSTCSVADSPASVTAEELSDEDMTNVVQEAHEREAANVSEKTPIKYETDLKDIPADNSVEQLENQVLYSDLRENGELKQKQPIPMNRSACLDTARHCQYTLEASENRLDRRDHCLEYSPQRLPLTTKPLEPSDEDEGSNISKCDRSKEQIPVPDPEGSALCHICEERFRDNLILKEHFEKIHPKEMFRCTVPYCDKLFSTRKSRNRHSQNDNLHRHLDSHRDTQM